MSAMSAIRPPAAGAAIALGLLLAPALVHASPNLLANGDFSAGLAGWTVTPFQTWTNPSAQAYVGAQFTSSAPGDNLMAFTCIAYCRPGNLVASQTIGLISGHTYELSLYARGGHFVPVSPGNGSWSPGGPFYAQLGTQGNLIDVPWDTDTVTAPYGLRTSTFTYTGATGPGTFSFIYDYLSENIPPCSPCAAGEQSLEIALASLTDTSPQTPPPPQVTEPTSLLSVSVGIGLLGVIFRRRGKARTQD